MEKFKALLRDVLQAGCDSLSLMEGQFIQTTGKHGPQVLKRYPKVEEAWLLVLYQNLFPKDMARIKASKAVLGVLHISGVGKVMMIAEAQPVRGLQLFLPPRGDKLCKDYWTAINRQGQVGEAQLMGVKRGGGDAPPLVAASLPFTSSMASHASHYPSEAVSPSEAGSKRDYAAEQGLSAEKVAAKTGLFAFNQNSELGGSSSALGPASVQPYPDEAAEEEEPHDPFGEPSISQHREELVEGDEYRSYVRGELSEHASLHAPDHASEEGFQQESSDEAYDNPAMTSRGADISQREGFPFFQAPPADYDEDLPLEFAGGGGTFPLPLPVFAPTEQGAPVGEKSGEAMQRPLPGRDPLVLASNAGNFKDQGEGEAIDFSRMAGGAIAQSTGDNAIDKILKEMMGMQASDLHLTIGQSTIFRVDGEIVRSNSKAIDDDRMKALLLPILPPFKKAQFKATWDVDFSYEVQDLGRFRVNLFRDNNGVGAVFRAIPLHIKSASELNLPPVLLKLCNLSKGLILVTGPTGSGKSTTLAAMVDRINQSRAEHILTVEDPIEFVYQQKKCLINQREVGKHTASFASALRAALREDPDIVLVGELRDLETTSIAIETAETGHLVLATLHTNTAVSTIDRIVDQFPSEEQRIVRNMLASSLRGVVSQTLCKKKAGGRVGAYELLIPNDAVRAMIREGKNHMISNHMQTQQSDGNCLLNEALVKLIGDNIIDYWEGWRKAIDKKEFEDLVKRRKIYVPPAP